MSEQERQEPAGKVAAADQEQAAAADPKSRARRNSAAQPVIDPQPCAPCRQLHEETTARLDEVEARVASLAKVVVTAVGAALVIYFLHGIEDARDQRRAAVTEG